MFEELERRIRRVVEMLENGGSLVVERITNQYGERIASRKIYYDPKGKIEEWGIACLNSIDFGLGTCHCNSHDPTYLTEIDFDAFINAIRNYLLEGLEKDLEHLKNRHKAQKLKERLREILNTLKEETDDIDAILSKLKHI